MGRGGGRTRTMRDDGVHGTRGIGGCTREVQFVIHIQHAEDREGCECCIRGVQYWRP